MNVLVKNYSVYSDLMKKNPLSIQKALCAKYFVNQKIDYLQKIKTISFIKWTAVTAKQSISVNPNGL